MSKGQETFQVADDPELLDLMLNDTENASDLYKPTNYWDNYGKKLIPQLKALGLHDFRRSKKMGILNSFGAADLLPISTVNISIGKWLSISPSTLGALLKIKGMSKFFRGVSKAISGVDLHDVQLLCYEYAKCYGEKNNAKPISDFSASTIGNPEDVFWVEDNAYTMKSLYYYIQYAYCCKFIDFDSIDSVMEIGSGAGKQLEVIKKLYSHITFFSSIYRLNYTFVKNT
jgi:putative sugar O-methyltransferase